ncbi:MAG: M48 family metallopeptidase [Magnetospirillum sp.]|nr:M48 family metallopeptidase [Magnetospirillum sp.]
MSALEGRFNDGRTAASRKVLVTPKAGGLDIRGEDGLLVAFWRTDDLRADGDLPGGKGVRLRCATDTGARLTLERAEFIRPLLPRKPRLPWAKLGAALVLAAALGAGLWLGLPAASRTLANLVPAAWEQRWGDAVAAGFQRRWGACRQPAGEAALHLLTDRLAAGLPPDQRPRRVVVVRTPDVNAFALPGGTVLIFSGLLADAQSPDEVAGVLAHEIAHLRFRHPTAALIRAAGVGVVVTLITGDSSGLVATGAGMALAGAYSREDEAAADRGAVALLADAGLDAQGLATFLRRLAAHPNGLPQWLNSHPDSAARAQAVEAAAKAGAPALGPEQWAALKGICGQ